MNVSLRSTMLTPLSRIREDLDAAMGLPRVAKIAAAHERLKAAKDVQTERQRAYQATVRLARQGRPDDTIAPAHAAAVEQAAEAVGMAEVEVVAARATLRRLVEDNTPAIHAAVHEPLTEIARIVGQHIADIEAAIDPLADLLAGLAQRGIPAPRLATAQDALLHHLRAVRMALEGRG